MVRGAWGAALLNLELYDLHVRPLVARISAKQKQLGGTARDAVREASAFLEEKVRKKPSPHWDVLLRWASSIDSASSLRERSDSEIQRFGVGPWEDESPTCIDTAIKRDAPS